MSDGRARARLVAGGFGVVLVLVAGLVFLQARHPQVAGTNTVGPYSPAWSIPAVSTRCQSLRRVPAGANRVRMALSSAPQEGPLQAAIVRHGTPVAQGSIRPRVGKVNFKLGRQTPAINRARLCISNLGKQRVVFLGEHKRTRRHPAAGTTRPVPSVIFLKPDTSSWLGRTGTIVRRFGYVQAGILGEWALWLAALLALAMFVLALWAVIAQREPRARPAAAEGPRGGIRTRFTRIPAAGWVCAIVALCSALTWSLIVPLFQVPDEQAHVAYAQHLAEVGAPPAGSTDASALSDQERNLLSALHWRQITHRPDNPPLRTPRAHRRLEAAVDRPADRAGEGGSSNATQNPPLYYSMAAAAYRLSPFTHLPDRVHAMRIVSALLAAITVLLAFLFLRELLPGTPWAWTVGGLAVAVQPMFGFIGGGVNNDNLLFAASAGVVLLLATGFRRGLTVRRGVALGACTAVGLLAKATMFGLLPGIAVGVILMVLRTAPAQRREAWRGAAAAAGVAAAPLLLYMALNSMAWHRGVLFGSPQAEGPRATAAIASRPATLTGHLSYIWQFYLPRLQVMGKWFPTYEAREIWFEGFIGRFGWLDYGFPGWVYDFGLVAGVGLLALAGRELVARVDALRRRFAELLTHAALILGLLGLLAWVGYDWRRGHPGQFEQARYILPLLTFYGALVALAARGAGRRWGPVIGVVIVSIALAQNILAMLITLTRYYG
jgi:4-amino-4-deoxy-L-arabinose transferase-like glycosyltransferase